MRYFFVHILKEIQKDTNRSTKTVITVCQKYEKHQLPQKIASELAAGDQGTMEAKG
jgi:hypothetical protein